MYIPKLNYKLILIVSICLLVFGVGFGSYAFPRLLRKLIKSVSFFYGYFDCTENCKSLMPWLSSTVCVFLIIKQVHVAKGSKLRPYYIKVPFFINFHVYLFNVTNKDDVIQGSE